MHYINVIMQHGFTQYILFWRPSVTSWYYMYIEMAEQVELVFGRESTISLCLREFQNRGFSFGILYQILYLADFLLFCHGVLTVASAVNIVSSLHIPVKDDIIAETEPRIKVFIQSTHMPKMASCKKETYQNGAKNLCTICICTVKAKLLKQNISD